VLHPSASNFVFALFAPSRFFLHREGAKHAELARGGLGCSALLRRNAGPGLRGKAVGSVAQL